jgi:two-component system nitrate/nitrite sensor histidine kinase NarX
VSFTRLKWTTILVPVLFIVCVEALTATYLERELGYIPSHIAQIAAISVVGLMFSVLLFGALERIQRRVEQHNAELAALNAVGHAVGATHDLEAAMSSALGSVMSVTGATAAEIVVDNDGGREGPLTVSAGPAEHLARLKEVLSGNDMAPSTPSDEAAHAARIVSIPSSPRQDRGPSATHATCAEVPLVVQDVHVGSLRLLALPGANLLSGTTERLLAAMGSQLAVGIQAGNLFRDVLQRGKEAEALFEIGLKIASLQDTQQVLDSVVAHASQALGTDAAALCLAGKRGRELAVAGRAGPAEAFLRPSTGVSPIPVWIEEGVMGRGRVRQQCTVLAAPYGRHHLAAPLRIGNSVIGDLCVSSVGPRAFTRRDRDLLDGLADMAAIALNNARLLDRERQLAVLEERERLSREMHDSLAQVLGYLHLKAETVRRALDKGGVAEASQGLEEMAALAQEAYQDVREAILGLRETLSPEEGLIGALREYVQKFGRQSGILTEIELQGEPPELSPAAEVQLVRVIQEALTNVRKHARAQRAVIRIAQHEGEVLIAIEDDGRGFDVAVANGDGQHFGVRTMRERLERVGGRFAIDSAPGEGTTVRIWFNRAEGEQHGLNTDPPRRRPGPLPERSSSLAGGRAGHDRGGGSV